METSNLKECSLVQAIELCKKNGGTMRTTPQYSTIYAWDNEKKCFINTLGGLVDVFSIKLLESKWIYEPPKQSAFQKWNKKGMNYHKNREEYQNRKAGWNAAIDEILKIRPDHYIGVDLTEGRASFAVESITKENINKLKEP